MLEFGSVDTVFDFVSYSTCAVCFPLNIYHNWGCYLLKVIIKDLDILIYVGCIYGYLWY